MGSFLLCPTSCRSHEFSTYGLEEKLLKCSSKHLSVCQSKFDFSKGHLVADFHIIICCSVICSFCAYNYLLLSPAFSCQQLFLRDKATKAGVSNWFHNGPCVCRFLFQPMNHTEFEQSAVWSCLLVHLIIYYIYHQSDWTWGILVNLCWHIKNMLPWNLAPILKVSKWLKVILTLIFALNIL